MVVENEYKELVQTRLPTKVRVCIDYQKLNAATHKDHFPLPFIDQMLERFAGHEYYYFQDGYSGYNQIPIATEDQEKTTFTSHSEPLPTDACPLDCATLLRHSNGACSVFSLICRTFSRDFYG